MASITIKVPNWLDFIFTCPLLIYRRLRFGYTYRRIYLGEGRFTIVEPRDFYWVNKFHWGLKGNSERSYAIRLVSTSDNNVKYLSLHRAIMGSPKGLLVDHKNRNRLDNRRANLRIATNSQNQFNKSKTRRKTASRFVGVTFVKSIGRWRAQIMLDRKNIFLGNFENETEAAKAYDSAAIKYHGEFARFNFPDLPQSSPRPLS
jgi:hypothetical protein